MPDLVDDMFEYMDTLEESDSLLDILCDRQTLEQPTKKRQESAMSLPTTVMGLSNTPVVIEDPVRFRQDLQTCVRMQMLQGIPTDQELKKIYSKGSMIEIALVKQLMQATTGDLDSFKYLMDRVLGKPVNQTNSISATVSYEDMLNQLNPDEVIKPKKVYCDDVSSY